MPNNYIFHPADNTEKMCEFAAQNHFAFPYSINHTQSVAKAHGAVFTLDFFSLNSNLELQYRDRLGNLTMGRGDTRTPELFDAMSMIGATDSVSERRVAAMNSDMEVCCHFNRFLKPYNSLDQITKLELYFSQYTAGLL